MSLDTIIGGPEDDILNGSYGDDPVIQGGAGDDILIGGTGTDMLYGEDDHDVILGDGFEFHSLQFAPTRPIPAGPACQYHQGACNSGVAIDHQSRMV